MDFCHLGEIYIKTSERQLLNAATKTGLDTLKTGAKNQFIKQLTLWENVQETKLPKKLENPNLDLIRI